MVPDGSVGHLVVPIDLAEHWVLPVDSARLLGMPIGSVVVLLLLPFGSVLVEHLQGLIGSGWLYPDLDFLLAF